jgi:hypothetical protein
MTTYRVVPKRRFGLLRSQISTEQHPHRLIPVRGSPPTLKDSQIIASGDLPKPHLIDLYIRKRLLLITRLVVIDIGLNRLLFRTLDPAQTHIDRITKEHGYTRARALLVVAPECVYLVMAPIAVARLLVIATAHLHVVLTENLSEEYLPGNSVTPVLGLFRPTLKVQLQCPTYKAPQNLVRDIAVTAQILLPGRDSNLDRPRPLRASPIPMCP